jgi:FkbM family methyltransferase
MLESAKKLIDYVNCAYQLGATPGDSVDILWRETKNLRVRLGMAHYQPDTVYSLKTRYGSYYFRDNFGDITNLTNLIYRDVYGIKTLKGPGVILDVGANIGLAAAWFARFNPDREIYCFEPLASNASLIRLNCPSASIHQVAVGAGPGTVSLGVDSSSVMASRLSCSWSTTNYTFETVCLDEFTARRDIKEVALLKIDAEGMEVDILNGARRTLRHVRRVAMETHGLKSHNTVIHTLSNNGLTVDASSFNGHTGMVFAFRN